MSRTKEIAFSNIVTARGRSGLIKMAGIEVTSSSHRNEVTLYPITSKGGISDAALA